MNPYRALFDAYVRELGEARQRALAWWDDLLAREAAATGSPETAELAVRARWPFGPTSHPFVIAVFRKYYLACERLNDAEEETAMPPAEDGSDMGWGEQGAEEEPDEPSDDAIWDEEGPLDPPMFLFDLLYGRHQDLAEFMAWLVFSPIGIEGDEFV